MYWMYLFYFLLAAMIFFGAQHPGRGQWNDAYTSLGQTKVLQGVTALGIALHHLAQKTCAPWNPQQYMVHGLDPFLQLGYLFVGVFLFCSGLGLYKSFKTKPDYLKGFFRRRILPIVVAYYLSEYIYIAVRAAMGEGMDFTTVVWYLSGLHMANKYAWYAVAIPFFYLAFWAAFRYCKREGVAIACVALFTLGYTVLGACIDQQSDWWMRGEWWYNSIMLFPLGLLFGRYEKQVTAFFKRGHWFWLLLAFAATILLFKQSEWVNEHAWGYYNAWDDPMKIPHRLMSAGLQWVVATAYVAFCFLLMMKVRFGNPALKWLGGMTLEFYLMHGLFVELFGFNFLDVTHSLFYIKNLPVYIAVVLGCSVPAAILFGFIWKRLVRLARGMGQGNAKPPRERLRKPAATTGGKGRFRRYTLPGVAALFLLLTFLLPPLIRGDERVRVMNGMVFHLPEHYARRYTERRYGVWEYAGEDRRPGKLVLDAEIRDDRARNLHTAEEVLASCDWLKEAELYINPQGVRMVRGYADYAGHTERRYYIESAGSVLLMCMIEDERYYSREDCEAAMRETADSVRPA